MFIEFSPFKVDRRILVHLLHFLGTQSAKLIHTADTGVDVANKAIFNFVLISYSPLITFSFKINAFRQDLPKSKKKKQHSRHQKPGQGTEGPREDGNKKKTFCRNKVAIEKERQTGRQTDRHRDR